jgi:hypothetical protein
MSEFILIASKFSLSIEGNESLKKPDDRVHDCLLLFKRESGDFTVLCTKNKFLLKVKDSL